MRPTKKRRLGTARRRNKFASNCVFSFLPSFFLSANETERSSSSFSHASHPQNYLLLCRYAFSNNIPRFFNLPSGKRNYLASTFQQSYLLFALVLLLFCKNGQCNYGHSVIIINKLAARFTLHFTSSSFILSFFSLNLKQTCGASALQLTKNERKVKFQLSQAIFFLLHASFFCSIAPLLV